MIGVSPSIVAAVQSTYGRFFARLSRLPAEKCAQDVLDEAKVHQNIALLCRCAQLAPEDLRGRKLLEVGSGFGVFLAVARRDYDVDALGIEPASEGFESTYDLSRQILTEYGQDPSCIHAAEGERIPFPDASFDLVYSSTVLEHTRSPEDVLRESLRVLKPGGHLMFVYPNYGAFFEGHYVIPWIPYLPRFLARWWLRLWGRDPAFVDTLQFTTYFKTRCWLRRCPPAEILTMGEEVFRERMLNTDDTRWNRWAGLHRIHGWVRTAQRLRVIRPLTALLLRVRSFDPIILTLRKPSAEADPVPPKR